MFKFELS